MVYSGTRGRKPRACSPTLAEFPRLLLAHPCNLAGDPHCRIVSNIVGGKHQTLPECQVPIVFRTPDRLTRRAHSPTVGNSCRKRADEFLCSRAMLHG